MTTKITKEEAVINALASRHGIEWSEDVYEAVIRAVRVADGRDTARDIAKRVARQIRDK